ncbi:MAG: (2Fe-2S)-binding protein [Planctomycetota bacterium]|jgi:NAD(P)H-nitrite reductase large subunit
MESDTEVCLCFHVSLGKIRSYLAREDPPVASLISECLGAGTGCGWCVPYLRELHRLHKDGEPIDLELDEKGYIVNRQTYSRTGERPDESPPGD